MFPVVFNDLCSIFYLLPPQEVACCMPTVMSSNVSSLDAPLPSIKQSLNELSAGMLGAQSSNQCLLFPRETSSNVMLRNLSMVSSSSSSIKYDSAKSNVIFVVVFGKDHNCAILESLSDDAANEDLCFSTMEHRFADSRGGSIISEVRHIYVFEIFLLTVVVC